MNGPVRLDVRKHVSHAQISIPTRLQPIYPTPTPRTPPHHLGCGGLGKWGVGMNIWSMWTHVRLNRCSPSLQEHTSVWTGVHHHFMNTCSFGQVLITTLWTHSVWTYDDHMCIQFWTADWTDQPTNAKKQCIEMYSTINTAFRRNIVILTFTQIQDQLEWGARNSLTLMFPLAYEESFSTFMRRFLTLRMKFFRSTWAHLATSLKTVFVFLNPRGSLIPKPCFIHSCWSDFMWNLFIWDCCLPELEFRSPWRARCTPQAFFPTKTSVLKMLNMHPISVVMCFLYFVVFSSPA